jgi:Flp pilus assembly protein TadD
MYADAGRDDEAVVQMEAAAYICPDDDYYMARYGMMLARVGGTEKAAGVYRKAISLSPTKLEYKCLLGDMYQRLGLEARAEHCYSETAEMDMYEADFVRRARQFTDGASW